MTTTITVQDGSGATTTPTLVLGYETSNASRNIVHDTLDGGIMVSLFPARPRAGTLALFYPAEADADEARQLHTRETTFALVTDDRPSVNMLYVVSGDVVLTLDDESREVWTVSVGYQEVIP